MLKVWTDSMADKTLRLNEVFFREKGYLLPPPNTVDHYLMEERVLTLCFQKFKEANPSYGDWDMEQFTEFGLP